MHLGQYFRGELFWWIFCAGNSVGGLTSKHKTSRDSLSNTSQSGDTMSRQFLHLSVNAMGAQREIAARMQLNFKHKTVR